MMLMEKQSIRSRDPNLDDKKPSQRLRKKRRRPAPGAKGREGEARGRRLTGDEKVPRNPREVRELIRNTEKESPLDSAVAKRWRRKGPEENKEEKKNLELDLVPWGLGDLGPGRAPTSAGTRLFALGSPAAVRQTQCALLRHNNPRPPPDPAK